MTTITIKHWHQTQPASLQETASSTWKLMLSFYERSHQRRQLAHLSSEQRSDMGISRQDAMAESVKPFWRH